jgi:uncharacterized protein YegL
LDSVQKLTYISLFIIGLLELWLYVHVRQIEFDKECCICDKAYSPKGFYRCFMSDFSDLPQAEGNISEVCLCVFVVDVSGSMNGEPIRQLNSGLQQFHTDIDNDDNTSAKLEVALVEFGSGVNVLQEPAFVYDFKMPTLTVHGTTPLVDGVREAINIVASRKSAWKNSGTPYLRPWIVLITDGAPDSDQDVDGLAAQIKAAGQSKDFMFMSIGVQGANMEMLKKISMTDYPPLALQGLKFSEFFKWLSASMGKIANSNGGSITMDPVAAWAQASFNPNQP